MPPLVSICLPNLNTRPFLEPRMESIFSQTLKDWELIICDSYSEDGAWEYFQRFRGDPRVRLCQVPREGIYAGWNECLRRAGGRYVYIAPSDDTMAPNMLETLVGALESQPDVQVAVSDYQPIDEAGAALPQYPSEWPRKFYGEWMTIPHLRNGKTEFLLHACLGIIWWTITAVVFRRSLLERIGYFRTDRGSQADEEWEMRAALASDVVYIPEKLATWRVHARQATAKLKGPNRTNLDCLESVLDDPHSGIPDSWRRVPDWQGRISRVCRTEYLCSYGLYRSHFREKPGQFVRYAWRAMSREPAFFLQQLCRGLKWSADFSPDPIAAAHELIRLFQSPWPPTRLAS